MKVKPNPNRKIGKESLKVFDPVHRVFLPESGANVPSNAYWLRRLQTGDVVRVDVIPQQKPNKKSKRKKEK